ncbi:BglG family transcription antiterminator [Carnobacterium sp.]|uniref:BglG family transcription antiterminator n=1 Tax=Carnobacterium sp. TaxID=48221 RepID=UPI0028AE8C48|nr:BglG family transcription antiterminator [Carnobacterium sp.]
MEPSLSREDELIQKLIRYIYNNKNVHYPELMEYTHYSRKTVSKYLDLVESTVKTWGVKLERKPNVGIYFSGNTKEISKMLSSIDKKIGMSVEDRRNSLILEILMSSKPLKVQALADSFFVSRGTLDQDIKYIKNKFSKYELKIIGDINGIYISASERMRRRIATKILSQYINTSGVKQADDFITKNHVVPGSLEEMINEELLEQIRNILTEFEEQSNLSLSDYDYQSLLIHLVVSIERIKAHQIIKGNNDNIVLEIEYETKLLVNLLENQLNIKIPDYEIGYLNIHILASQHRKISVATLTKTEGRNELGKLAELLKTNLISYDDELISGLILHLEPAIKRFKLGLQIHNPYTNEILKFFPEAFDQSLMIVSKLEQIFLIKIEQDEIAYVALHIQSYLERTSQSSKVTAIIACSTGLGTAQLLTQRLEKRFSESLTITRVLSIREMMSTHIYEDLVISTIPIDIPNVTIVQITPFADKQSIKFLDNKIIELLEVKKDFWSFMKLIKSDYIFLNSHLKNEKEVIEFLGQKLIQNGYGETPIIESALHREKLATTAIPEEKFALPHAEVKHVKRPIITIYINQNGINWMGQTVNIVFFIALNKEVKKDINNIYQYFNEILENNYLISKLISASTSQQVIDLLKKGVIE